MDDPRRRTPRTDGVLASPEVAARIEQLGRERVKSVVAEVLAACRRGEIAPEDVVAAVSAALPESSSSLRAVVNATGVIVHTNLGRAPLSAAAVDAVCRAAGATNVEFDLTTGRRARRGTSALAALRSRVPDAEDVHVVNNGAAALALATSVLARGRRVVIARGELVEIGDGFRIPELLESVGAELREVGTTNRARLADYEQAIDESVAFVLKVHPSNFRIEGFTSSVAIDDLARLGPPVVVDIGSGLLSPHPRLPAEPDATTALRAGAALVTASGDKLLGGPQCGLLLGRGELIEMLRRDPLARAMRVDKLTLAALEATLAGPPSPVERSLEAGAASLMARARDIAAAIGPPADVALTLGRVGGGGAPGVELESAAIALPHDWAEPLRTGRHAVVGRVQEGSLLLDLLAVPAEQDHIIVEAVRAVASRDEA